MSLVFYHRGLKLRPELQEFRLGIQKAQEAIDNSVGCKLTEAIFPNYFPKSSELKTKTQFKKRDLQQRKSSWTFDGTNSLQSSLNVSNLSSLPANRSSKQKTKKKQGNSQLFFFLANIPTAYLPFSLYFILIFC